MRNKIDIWKFSINFKFNHAAKMWVFLQVTNLMTKNLTLLPWASNLHIFHSVNHLIMMRKAMRFYADHKYLTGMTITNRKMLVHPELETVLSKLDLCHVYVCLVVDFSCPFVLMLQHCSYISKICAEISDNSKKG